MLTSLAIVIYKTVLIESPCDPKFECICSLSCLLIPIVIITAILGLGLIIAYLSIGRGAFVTLNRRQIYIFSLCGCLLGALAFVHPLITIVIIYGGYIILWLPISIVASIGVIQISKKYNNAFMPRPRGKRSAA